MSLVLDQSYGTPFSGGTTSTLTANSARIGADGIIFALPGENGCDYTMRIYNSDLNDNEKKLLLDYFNLKNK